MKRQTMLSILVVLLATPTVGVFKSTADYGYSFNIAVRDSSDFYEPLAGYGSWVNVQPYGWCWYPAYVDASWRPYANGHWLWSDSGWYWVSEEPWAWACYHYGRWVWTSYYGWVWLPGTEWAPSWVCWREGGDYIGWAPLPPECDFDPYDDVIRAEQIVIAPTTFVFIDNRHFCDRITPSVLVINQTIVYNTVNITNIRHVNQTVCNRGPGLTRIQQVTPRPVPVASVPLPVGRQTGQPPAIQPGPGVRPRREPPQLTREQIREQTPRPVRIVRGTDPSNDPTPAIMPNPRPPRTIAPLPPRDQRPVPPGRNREDREQRPGRAAPRPVPQAPVVLANQQPSPPPAVPADTADGNGNRHDREHHDGRNNRFTLVRSDN